MIHAHAVWQCRQCLRFIRYRLSCALSNRSDNHRVCIQRQVIPVLLGQGRRLFENMPPDHIELELVRALDGPGVQHLRYRVRKEG